jgi:hypothetical protein
MNRGLLQLDLEEHLRDKLVLYFKDFESSFMEHVRGPELYKVCRDAIQFRFAMHLTGMQFRFQFCEMSNGRVHHRQDCIYTRWISV